MALSPEVIAKINDLLAKREAGVSNPDLAATVGCHPAVINSFVGVLRKLGADIPDGRGVLQMRPEYREALSARMKTVWAAFRAQQQAAAE